MSAIGSNIHNKSPSPIAPVAPHISAKAMSGGRRSAKLRIEKSMESMM